MRYASVTSPVSKSPSPLAVTKEVYVLDGQHKLLAVNAAVKRLEGDGKPEPDWAKNFRCKRIKGEVDYQTRRTIAGREQARMATMDMSWEATATLILGDIREEREKVAHDPTYSPRSTTNILEKVYQDSGRSVAKDGTQVGHPPTPPSPTPPPPSGPAFPAPPCGRMWPGNGFVSRFAFFVCGWHVSTRCITEERARHMTPMVAFFFVPDILPCVHAASPLLPDSGDKCMRMEQGMVHRCADRLPGISPAHWCRTPG